MISVNKKRVKPANFISGVKIYKKSCVCWDAQGSQHKDADPSLLPTIT